MIYDKLSNIKNYMGMNPNLDEAIGYIQCHDLNLLPLGKNTVKGEEIFVNIMNTSPTPADGRDYEAHQKYIDIQIVLDGCEQVDTGIFTDEDNVDYNAETDYYPVKTDVAASVVLRPGYFTICMVEEPHRPCVLADGCTSGKKAVVKVMW